MANKNKNNAPVRTTPQGFKTRSGADNSVRPVKAEPTYAAPAVERTGGVSRRTLIAIVAAVVALAIIAGLVLTLVLVLTDDGRVDYLNDDLSKYLTIKEEDYKGVELDIPLLEYSDLMLESSINALLVEHKSTTAEYDAVGQRSVPISLGDVVKIWVRGYTVDENGRETEVAGTGNFTYENYESLEIGSADMILGFEEALIGLVPSDYSRFSKIKSGTVAAGDVIYLTYTSYSKNENKSYTAERIDLSRSDLDSVYGEGFTDYIIGKEIGVAIDEAKTFTLGDGSVGYYDMKVEFATRCEDNPITFSINFPANYSYSKELRGKLVTFDVYIDHTVVYNTPEYNEQLVTEKLGFTADELASYAGDTLVDKHTSYIKSNIEKNIKTINENLLIEAYAEHLDGVGEITELPEAEVESYYQGLYNNIENYYNDNSTYFASIDDAAISYYSLESGDDWQSYIRVLAEKEVQDKLKFYYVITAEGLIPTEEELKAEEAARLQAEIDYQLSEHADELAGLDEAEYAEQVELIKQAVIDYLGENGLRELAYYNLGMKKIVEELCVIA